jgi:hypothetical protein
MSQTTQLVNSESDEFGRGETLYTVLVADGLASGNLLGRPEQLFYHMLFEPAVFSGLWVKAQQSTTTAASTVTLRKNSANAAPAVSLLAGATGPEADSVDTEWGSAIDCFDYRIDGGRVFRSQPDPSAFWLSWIISILMQSGRTTSWMNGGIYPGKFDGYGIQAFTYDTPMAYGTPGGYGGWSLIEAEASYTVRFPLETFGLLGFVTSNSIDASTTFQMRHNNAPGNQAKSVAPQTVGAFMDFHDTDIFQYGDTVNYSYSTSGGSSGVLGTTSCTCTCFGMDGYSFYTGGNGGAPIPGYTPFNYCSFTGDASGILSNPNDADAQLTIGVPFVTYRFMSTYIASVPANTGFGVVTYESRVNGAPGNLAKSALFTPLISQTGYLEDVVDSDYLGTGDLYNTLVSYSDTPSWGWLVNVMAVYDIPEFIAVA